MTIGPPISEFAARIVRNKEYQNLVDAILEQGGSLSDLIAAVNRHRYTVDDDHPDAHDEPVRPTRAYPSALNRAGWGGVM